MSEQTVDVDFGVIAVAGASVAAGVTGFVVGGLIAIRSIRKDRSAKVTRE